jgi:hypothetical protein
MDEAQILQIIMDNARLEYEHARAMAVRERDQASANEAATETPARRREQPHRGTDLTGRGSKSC